MSQEDYKIPIIACQLIDASRVTGRFVGSKSMMYPICVQWNTFQSIWWGIASSPVLFNRFEGEGLLECLGARPRNPLEEGR